MNKNWLNVFGRLIFQNKENKYLFAERPYRTHDSVLYIDDTRGFAENVGRGKFSEMNMDEWIPITREEFNMIKRSYREILLIRQAIEINNQWKAIK